LQFPVDVTECKKVRRKNENRLVAVLCFPNHGNGSHQKVPIAKHSTNRVLLSKGRNPMDWYFIEWTQIGGRTDIFLRPRSLWDSPKEKNKSNLCRFCTADHENPILTLQQLQ